MGSENALTELLDAGLEVLNALNAFDFNALDYRKPQPGVPRVKQIADRDTTVAGCPGQPPAYAAGVLHVDTAGRDRRILRR